ncbi:lipocalin-like domain-containing protein [Bradyrhizobium sp. BR 1432]|uniref:lipocalin-like domain-containing protein n=1 Tax=Bradyrhizobium sp. BR 1432 TaxID=3447966 RepID=UPI003EE5D652
MEFNNAHVSRDGDRTLYRSSCFRRQQQASGHVEAETLGAARDDTKEQKASPFGERPAGYVLFTSSYRLFVLITAEDRRAPEGPDGQSAAFRTMYAYSGKYRLEDGRFITTVDNGE